METLLELINVAKIEDEQNVSDTTLNIGNELKELGFSKMSDKILKSVQLKNRITNIAKQKYLKITTKMIEDYLDNKVNEYNKVNAEINFMKISGVYEDSLYTFNPFLWEKISDSRRVIIEKYTCDYISSKSDTIGKFVWIECPIEEYEGIPPKEVLDKLKIHKDKLIFDYFTIALVKNVKDPLLFGRINENDNRY